MKNGSNGKGSQTEYSILTKAVLGRLDDSNFFPTNDLGMLAMIAADEKIYTTDGSLDIEMARTRIPEITDKIKETTQKELAELEKFYIEQGIEIVRPHKVGSSDVVETENFKTNQYPVYCPRDILLNFRDLLIVSPNLYRSRSQEMRYYEDILVEEEKLGRKVITAPRPRLSDEDFNLTADANCIVDTEYPVFEAANVLIDGEHDALYYQISHSGNKSGYTWLSNVITSEYPEVTVYPLYVYSGIHIDTTIAIFNHDLVALNPERVTDIEALPEPLRKRKHIFPDLIEIRNKGALSSKWIGMNSLSISPTKAVVDADQVRYIEQLVNVGIDIHPHKLTYCDIIEGGHHCTTSDLRREENY